MRASSRAVLQRDATTVLMFAAMLAPLAAWVSGWQIPAPLGVPLDIHALTLGLLAALGLLSQGKRTWAVVRRFALLSLSAAGLAFVAAAILAHRANAFYTSGVMIDGMALLLLVHLAGRGLRRRCLSSLAAVRLADDLAELTGLAILGAWILIAFEHRHIVGPLLLLAGTLQVVAATVLLPGAMASFGWLAGKRRARGGLQGRARSLSSDVRHFGTALLVSGSVLMVLGAAALRWPDESLLEAKAAAAMMLAVVGAYELLLAIRVRATSPAWLVALAAALTSFGMAIFSIIIAARLPGATMVLPAVWLTVLAVLMTAGAFALWPMPRTRTLLLSWSGTNVVLAGLALWTRPPSAVLLYAGAAYTVAVGASQFAAAVWMRRWAEPWFAPTVQSGWRPTA